MGRRSAWYLLLVVAFVGPLWVTLYNEREPSLAGVPFFYWFQLLWVLLGSLLMAVVYFATSTRGRTR